MSNILDVLTNYTSELLGGNRARVPHPFLPSLTSKDYGGEPVAPSLPRLPQIPPPVGSSPVRTRAETVLPPVPRALPRIGEPPVAPTLTPPDQYSTDQYSQPSDGSNSRYFSTVLNKLGLPTTPQNHASLRACPRRDALPQELDRFNLLGTTLPVGGSRGTNRAGVQSYPSFEAGTSALAK